jgi:hypothetical protein
MYSFVEPELHSLADSARDRLEKRYGLKKVAVEKSFDNSISFVPTFHWKKDFHIFICEVSERPFPKHIKEIFSDLLVADIPAKVFVAYPEVNDLSTKELHDDLQRAKEFGLGLISVGNNNQATIMRTATSVPLLPRRLELSDYARPLRTMIEDAYDIYLNGDPAHGIQEVGQIVENIIRNAAISAKQKGLLTKGGDPADPKYAQGNIIDDLIRERVIDTAVLGRSRAFVVDRNDSSHKPKNRKEAIARERNLKDNFQTGLRILRDLPPALKQKKLRFKP